MNRSRKLLAVLLSLCLVFSLIPMASATEPPRVAAPDEVVIYYTNDVHTYIDKSLSYDGIADLKAKTAEQAAGVLLVDAGDHIQGTAYGSMDKGATIVKLMNAAGYDLATLGNHEFDYTMDGTMAVIEAADYPYISANFYHEGEYVNPFTDVAADSWYAKYVLDLAKREILVGVTPTLAAPNAAVTRAQFATILYRIHGAPAVTGLANPFTDVAEGTWYTDAVKWAAAEGVVAGTSATTFEPNANITREQMITMLYRAVGNPEAAEKMEGFTDALKVSDWAKKAMSWGIEAGLISGVAAGLLAPYADTTRAQIAKVLDLYYYANVEFLDTVLDSYQVYEVGGYTVAFVGITTPESFTKSTPAYFQDENGNYIYGIAGGEDGKALYQAVQAAINEVHNIYRPDYVIALAHLGDDPASQPWTSEEMIANVVGLDAVIDGHSHSTIPMKEVTDAAGNTVILTQTGEYFDAIGRLSITEDGIKSGLITLEEVEDSETGEVVETYVYFTGSDGEAVLTDWAIGSDAAVAKIKNDWIDEIQTKLGEVIGYAEVTFDNYDADGNRLVRKQETNTGDFAADALYYLFDNMDLDVDVAIMNGGGVRNKAVTGELSYLTCKSIHTFGNVACLQTITGQQLLDALEWGARGTNTEEVGGFLHVSGIAFEIDTTIESTVQADDKGVWIGGPTGEYRVKNVMFWNEETQAYDIPLDLEAKYNLAGYNYTLRDLGDGFAMFDCAVNVLDYVMEDYLVLANYVKSFPVDAETGLPTITAENSPYGNVTGEGRITLITE